MPNPTGLHHITAVAGDPQQNLDFYSGLLGLRLIKKTVNIDDPSSYHLFYGTAENSPGSTISFFTSPQMSQGEPDIGGGIAVSFSIPITSVDYWIEYLTGNDINFMDPFKRFGKLVIGFQDPDGLYLELIGSPTVSKKEGRQHEFIPPQHAIRGLHGITLAEKNYQATGQLLSESFGFEEIEQEHDRMLYQSGADLGGVIELIDDAKLEGKPGKGTVHHIAFRAEDKQHQEAIRKDLEAIGYHLTETEDRHYFQSFFFHEPGGALLEVATAKPGFTIDEKIDNLGNNLCLPPKLESKRALIEAELPELKYK